MSKTILLDIDGVLADFVKGYSEIAHEMYGTPPLDTVTCPMRNIAGVLGLTAEEDRAIWYVIEHDDCFWFALAGLVTDRELDHIVTMEKVIFVTTRPTYARKQTREWLDERWLLQPCIHVTRKAPLLHAFGQEGYVLDDDSNTIHEMCLYLSANPTSTWKPLLMNRRYNEMVPDLPRVNTIEEFLKEIE